MTDFRLTQAAAEQWASITSPTLQVTQVAVEQWVTTNVTNPYMTLTQVAVEQWAQLVPAVLPGGAQARVMVMA
jgi:hypothetical protein